MLNKSRKIADFIVFFFTTPKAALAYLAVKVGMVSDNPYMLHYLQQIPVFAWDSSVGDLGTALTPWRYWSNK